jgi:hypothetical protein
METGTKSKKSQIFILYLLVVLPLVMYLIYPDEKPLNGAFYSDPNVRFTMRSWFEGDFQNKKDHFFNHHFGLHNFLVRLKSECDFRLFQKSLARFVVVGKENYLYETDYIRAYYGEDFIGEKKLAQIVAKLKEIQDSLSKKKKLILTVVAPGKARFYPEFIPDRYQGELKPSNRDGLVKQLIASDVPHVDFASWFISKKKAQPDVLYPQYGIHWSNYGALLALDSILKKAQHYLGRSLCKIKFSSIKVSDLPEPPDNDVEEGMNLLFPLKHCPMVYPQVLADNCKKEKVKTLVIADSFWWYLYGTGIPDQIFSENRFWYYNENMYPESFNGNYQVKESFYQERIRDADLIIILHSEATLYKFGNGFVDMCYESICRPDPEKEKIQAMKGKIRATDGWYKEIVKKAAERNISTDSMLEIDARYMQKK